MTHTKTKRQSEDIWIWLISAFMFLLPFFSMAQDDLTEEKKTLEAEKQAIEAERQALEEQRRALHKRQMALHERSSALSKEDQVASQKVAFITTHLELTPEESQQFWPVYNQYENEMKEEMSKRKAEMKALKEKGLEEASDNEIENAVDGEIAHAQRMLDIKKKYHARFKEVLPVKKLARLYHAEDQFKKRLLTQLGRKRMHEGKGMPMHDRH